MFRVFKVSSGLQCIASVFSKVCDIQLNQFVCDASPWDMSILLCDLAASRLLPLQIRFSRQMILFPSLGVSLSPVLKAFSVILMC
jgi:hypothetical protein